MREDTSSERIKDVHYLVRKLILFLGLSGFTALVAALGLSFKGYPVIQTFFTTLGGVGIVLIAVGEFSFMGTTTVRPARTIMPGAVSAAELQSVRDNPSAKDRFRLDLAQSVSLILSGIILVVVSFFFT
ncbi:MAG: hypothetical protein HXS48_14795 [Theionarchaea archaeon]|nr:hypothetical protein [Theionarchaea archaeon]